MKEPRYPSTKKSERLGKCFIPKGTVEQLINEMGHEKRVASQRRNHSKDGHRSRPMKVWGLKNLNVQGTLHEKWPRRKGPRETTQQSGKRPRKRKKPS